MRMDMLKEIIYAYVFEAFIGFFFGFVSENQSDKR